MKTKLLIGILTLFFNLQTFAQSNAPSIQSGVTFQWSDNQTAVTHPATIQSITVNGNLYFQFGIPTAYELTQLGPNGHGYNSIRLNGPKIETTSASPTWDASALNAYQSLNLNNYFETNGNGANICDDYTAEETTNAQRQTLSYGDGIIASSSGVIAITERNANNCYHVEFFGIPVGGGSEQSLGETFVNQGSTKYGFGGTGTSSSLGTPGAVNAPNGGSDYWLSDRVIDNYGTIGIALFYLDDIAPTGSIITKAQLTAATRDDGDGKLFILTLPDHDNDGLSDIDDLDDENDGILDTLESGGIDPSADHDIDGIPNYQDSDFCTLNSFGICENLDFDSDGIPNHFDIDSDNDGIRDVLESGGIDTNNDGHADGTVGLTPTTIGIPNTAGIGTIPYNSDSSGNYNFLDLDSDNDGIPDNVEAQPTNSYTTPNNAVSTNGVDTAYTGGLTPVDTDYDGTPDYIDLNSDNDSLLDIEENGMANALSGSDTDSDGLDNSFEGSNLNDALDVNDEMNNPSSSILPDLDGDVFTGGDLDYRDLFNVNPPASATLDFDGVDDYLSGESVLNGLGELTLMAWVKIDPTNAGNSYATIVGEDTGCQLYVQNGNKIKFRTTTGVQVTGSFGLNANYDEWVHVTGIFSAATGTQAIYINGELKATTTEAGQIGQTITTTGAWNGNFEIGRESKNTGNTSYFNGEIDEVRVFDRALTADQIQRMIYQEIEDNSGKVKGSVIPKDIVDISTGDTVSWDNLIAYYPMSDIKNSTTSDYSNNTKTLRLKNITTIQEQTAPMPYVSSSDGAWTNEDTWLHGAVWDIEAVNSNKPWSIVQVESNVTTSGSHENLGLIINASGNLNVDDSNEVKNSWYLELNGALDLKDDSQLLQTTTSDLVTGATGRILRRQEGASSYYWYNYWSSPVGSPGVTTLSDNNASVNNANNSTFKLNALKDGSEDFIEFTNAYQETGKLSTRWFYTYENGVTYYDWSVFTAGSGIEPGVGYIHKGTGVGSEQQYTFEGKPNNGTIRINVSDVGGSGSEAAVSKTEYLLGNPYPSALDITQFITDNQGVISGSVQLWQQWAGDSHTTTEYQGGYAVVNKLGSVRAYQFTGGSGAHTGSQDGTKAPSKYLSVGQSFLAEIVSDGKVEFNNNQRIFKKESDYNGGFDSGSIFFRETASRDVDESEEGIMQKIGLEFNSVDGQATRRELLLGFSEMTTDDYDYGYEAYNTEDNHDDLYLMLDGEYLMMQAYGPITTDKEVPLALKTSGAYSYTIKLTKTENIDDDQEVYLRDNLTGTYFDLRQNTEYTFTSEEGIFNERFDIVFEEEQSLSTEDFTTDQIAIFYANTSAMLYVKGLDVNVSNLKLINMLGQSVYTKTNVSSNTLENGLAINKLATGIYIVSIKTDENQTIDKKIVIE